VADEHFLLVTLCIDRIDILNHLSKLDNPAHASALTELIYCCLWVLKNCNVFLLRIWLTEPSLGAGEINEVNLSSFSLKDPSRLEKILVFIRFLCDSCSHETVYESFRDSSMNSLFPVPMTGNSSTTTTTATSSSSSSSSSSSFPNPENDNQFVFIQNDDVDDNKDKERSVTTSTFLNTMRTTDLTVRMSPTPSVPSGFIFSSISAGAKTSLASSGAADGDGLTNYACFILETIIVQLLCEVSVLALSPSFFVSMFYSEYFRLYKSPSSTPSKTTSVRSDLYLMQLEEHLGEVPLVFFIEQPNFLSDTFRVKEEILKVMFIFYFFLFYFIFFFFLCVCVL
jgi:hypothetical protein